MRSPGFSRRYARYLRGTMADGSPRSPRGDLDAGTPGRVGEYLFLRNFARAGHDLWSLGSEIVLLHQVEPDRVFGVHDRCEIRAGRREGLHFLGCEATAREIISSERLWRRGQSGQGDKAEGQDLVQVSEHGIEFLISKTPWWRLPLQRFSATSCTPRARSLPVAVLILSP